MNRVLILFVLVVFTIPAISQLKPKVYKLTVYTKTGRIKTGYLRGINDSCIVISPQPLLYSPPQSVSYKSIRLIKARDRLALFKGPIKGAASGVFLGAILGFASYHDPYCLGPRCLDFGPGGTPVGDAILGGVLGGLIGLAAGSPSEKIQVQSASNSFDLVTGQLTKFIFHPDEQ